MKYSLLLPGAFLLACLLVFRFVASSNSFHSFSQDEKIQITYTLRQEPKIRYGQQQFSVNITGFEPVYVRTTLFPEYHYGDTIYINGSIEKKLLEDGRQIATLTKPTITLATHQKNPYQQLRASIADLYQKTLSPIHASLLMGIVFGSKESLPDDFKTSLQREGLTHIIAASGMNVSIITTIVVAIAGLVLHRRTALACGIVGIVLYVLLTGGEPSIIRAALMSSIAVVGQLLGRQRLSLISLVLAAYIMLFYDPLLIFDVGFQLSFLATSGIIYLKPVCETLFFTKKRAGIIYKMIKEDLTTTLSAQILTFPILLVTFGEVNLASVIINLFVLWTIPILMIIGLVAALLGILIPFLGKLVLFLSLPLLWYFETVVRLGTPLFLPIHIEGGLPLVLIASYYILLLSIVSFKRYEKDLGNS